MIYLDYNATAPMRPEVAELMRSCFEKPYNPSSVHGLGREAKRKLEDAREVIARHISCFANEVIFMASGTEANNMALRGFPDRPLLVGQTEHPSIKNMADKLGGDSIPVDSHGLIDLDILESKLKALGKPALVSVMLANNETGVIQPIKHIADIAHQYDALVHSDAVQLFGKAPMDMGLLGVDMLTITAHKMGGPVGAAALILRNDIPIKPFLYGGNQELGRRASTENVAAVCGFAKAIELAMDDDAMQRVNPWMDSARQAIKEAIPDVAFAGEAANRLPHVICMMAPNIGSENQLMHLDLAGICVSAGSACSSGRIAPSHVLKAMGYSDAMAGTALRISAGWATTEADIQQFSESWLEMAQRLRKKAA